MFFVEYIEYFLSSFQFIFAATLASFVLKLCILFFLIRRIICLKKIEKPFFFLVTILISNMFSDCAWVLKLGRILFFPQLGYKIVLLFTRIAWIFFIVQYQTLILFLESLIVQKYRLSKRQLFFCVISFLFCSFFVGIALLNFNCTEASQRLLLEAKIQDISILYVIFFLAIPNLLIVLQKIKRESLPLILRRQLFVLINSLIIPLLVADFIQVCPFKIRALEALAHNYAAVSFTTIFLTLAIYFCARKIFGLRFLNLKTHVQRPMNINFIEDFKGILERLSSVTSCRELGHITQSFFKETFEIPVTKTHLYFRKIEDHMPDQLVTSSEETITSLVETFLVTHANIIDTMIKEEKILIYDEIEFTHFYDACESSALILQFLRTINADIFLPVYESGKLIAYIIVERHARMGNFYSNVERDELLVFSSYLGNIINLLQNKQFDVLIEQEQYLRNELYNKHQEIHQYKESIRSFIRKDKSQHIGIIFYKNRHFIFGNQSAKELIDLNLNTHQGHPLVQALKKIAQQVETFKAPQVTLSKLPDNSTIVLSAVPHLEQNTVIITVSYPTISDTIKQSIDLLKDPTEWDYLLYLQTTESGKLINKLIPGTGPLLLNFKIELLKASLSKKAILLDMPEQDLRATAEILHHINLREIMHTITLQGPCQNYDIAVALFGINPLFALNTQKEKPLLEALDSVGTLFIKNIHFLDMETQENLASFIRYGHYSVFKSEKKMVSDVRIICSSNQNLSLLVQAGKFSKALFQELKTTTLSMPSLISLPEDELQALAEGFTQQVVVSDALQHILELTEREKNLLVINRPMSLQELKNRVQQLLVKKSKKNLIYQEVEFDPAYDVADPDLIAAARLGKQALKDQRIMILLWNKFKNQNKISAFLGVNRSSVNRRCKEYNLI
jgi:hypothetical protein